MNGWTCDVCSKDFLPTQKGRLHYTGEYELKWNAPVVKLLCQTCWDGIAHDISEQDVLAHMRSENWSDGVMRCSVCTTRFDPDTSSFWAVRRPSGEWLHVCFGCLAELPRNGLLLRQTVKARPAKQQPVHQVDTDPATDAEPVWSWLEFPASHLLVEGDIERMERQ